MASGEGLNKNVDSIRESEDQFRSLAELAVFPVFIFQETRFRFVNSAMESLTGFSRDELLGMNFYDIVHPHAKKKVRDWGLRLQRNQKDVASNELLLVTKAGEERWIEIKSAVITFQGKAAGLCTGIDITERKRSELLQDAVYRIAQSADKAQRLDDLFPAIHEIICEVMIAENFYIALYDSEKDWLSFPYFVDQSDRPTPPGKPDRGLTEYVLRTGSSLLCTLDVHAELERKGEIELIGPQSPIWLGVPLIVDETVIGVMVVQDYEDENTYGSREKRILEFVSSQVAMAIKRKRSEDALRDSESRYRRQAEEFAALYDVTRDIATERNLTGLLNTISERIVSLLGVSGCVVYLYREDHNDLEIVEVHGTKGISGDRIGIGEGLAGKVAETRQAIIVDDYNSWDLHTAKEFETNIPSAVAGVPMIFSGELVGVLVIYEAASIVENEVPQRKYKQVEIELLSFFAGVAASAVHNAQLFEETRQRLLEIEVLYQASLAAAQIHSVKAVGQRIVEALEQLMNWPASIWVISADQKNPTLLAYGSRNLSGEKLKAEIEQINTLITSVDTGIVGWVCKVGQAVRANDVLSDPRYIAVNGDIRSELCIPLRVGGKTIGCINVESTERNAFGDHDERLLTAIANQAAIAMENARLFEETRKRALRQMSLNAVVTAAARAGTDLDAFLNIALEQTLQALGLDMGAIWLLASSGRVHRVIVRGLAQSLAAEMAKTTRVGSSTTQVVVNWSEQQGSEMYELFQSFGINSSIAVPMIQDGKRVGGLIVATSQVHFWSEDEVSLIETIGREVGAAAERERLFDETSARLAELEAVNRVSTALRQANSLDEMLPNLLDETLQVLSAQAGGVWLCDNDRSKLKLFIGRGWYNQLGEFELESGQGIPGAVFSTGDIYFSREILSDPLLYQPTSMHVPAGWAGLCVPIRAGQETIGALIISDQLPREFSVGDARLIITLVEIAGNAILRMRLHEQTENYTIELEERVRERTAELQQALQKSQMADRLKSEFIANINHELRTPLTNLVLYYQMLRAQPNTRTEERLNVIGRELQRLRNLIEDLLNLSRMDMGQMSFHPMLTNINELVQPLIEDRRPLAEEHGLNLTLELAGGLPKTWVDGQMITQIVSNLLTNALNYTPRGGHVWVRTLGKKDGSSLVGISVQDDGPGITEEDKPHLFDRFYRGKAGHDSGAPGTGLGLAIVKQVVEWHEGTIELESGDNDRHGAKFTVWIPIKEKEPERQGP